MSETQQLRKENVRQYNRIAELEAERDALRDRRCEGCRSMKDEGVEFPPYRWYCTCSDSARCDCPVDTASLCECWQPREEDEG